MRHRSVRMATLVVLLLVFCAAPSTFALPKPQPGCVYTCEKGLDTTECKTNAAGTFLAARTCEVVPNCVVHTYDPDGQGGTPPILIMTCTYDCAMEFCVWV